MWYKPADGTSPVATIDSDVSTDSHVPMDLFAPQRRTDT